MSWLLAHTALVLVSALTVLASRVILTQRRPPQATVAWLLAVVLVPYIGLPLYFMLGVRKHRGTDLSLGALAEGCTVPLRQATSADRLVRSYGLPGMALGNAFLLLDTGEAAYHTLLEMVEAAEHTLWVSLFIVADDAVGRAFLQALTRRATDGLDVRVMLDAVGSRALPMRRLDALRAAGGHTAWYGSRIGRSIDLRNHRKLVLADQRRVFAGGMNVTTECMGPTPDIARWRDLAFHLEGPAAAHFTAIFRADWTDASADALTMPPFVAGVAGVAGTAMVQVVPSGPAMTGDVLFDVMLSLIFSACDRLWIVTPYFIPGDTLSRALLLAVRRGVDVRIIIPARSNHTLADLARGPDLRDLRDAGAQIIRYAQGMLHAKALVSDQTAVLGSANFDLRSFFLNAETIVLLSSENEVACIARWVHGLCLNSVPELADASARREFAEAAARLIGPLL